MELVNPFGAKNALVARPVPMIRTRFRDRIQEGSYEQLCESRRTGNSPCLLPAQREARLLADRMWVGWQVLEFALALLRALSRWLTGGVIFWLISLGRVVRGERVAVVQGAPVPGRGHLPLCVAVLPF